MLQLNNTQEANFNSPGDLLCCCSVCLVFLRMCCSGFGLLPDASTNFVFGLFTGKRAIRKNTN